MSAVFVDTWAWFALMDLDNADHEIAQLANEELFQRGATFCTTNYVLSEAVTLIRYKLNHSAALRFRRKTDQMVADGALTVMRVSEKQEVAAGEIFDRYRDVVLSFVDCTSFVVMRELGLTEAFTGDSHFSMMGFSLIP